MQSGMEKALRDALAPVELEIVNESALHAGHAGHREAGGGDNTHFRLRIVSEVFTGKPRVARHRMVYAALGEAWGAGLHALAIDAKTPDEVAG